MLRSMGFTLVITFATSSQGMMNPFSFLSFLNHPRYELTEEDLAEKGKGLTIAAEDAIRNDRLEDLKVLFKRGLDDYVNEELMAKFLAQAIVSKRPSIVLYFIKEKKVCVNTIPNGKKKRSQVHYAVLAKNEEILTTLLEYNANVNDRDEYGWSPLLHALYGQWIPGVHVLLAHGAEVHINAPLTLFSTPNEIITPLFLARNCGTDTVDLLMSYGADTRLPWMLIDAEKSQLTIQGEHFEVSFTSNQSLKELLNARESYVKNGTKQDCKHKPNYLALDAFFCNTTLENMSTNLQEMIDIPEWQTVASNGRPCWQNYLQSLIKRTEAQELISNKHKVVRLQSTITRDQPMLLIMLKKDIRTKNIRFIFP